MKRSIAIVAYALIAACSQSNPSQPTSSQAASSATATPAPTADVVEAGPCGTGFVEIVPGKPACGIALEADGSLAMESRRTPPIIASYQEGATAQIAIPAREIILFPPSPQNGFRIIQACETADANSLCWAVRLLYPKTATLHEIAAGKYGPAHWVRWSPQEQRVALISRNEGAEWLHVIDTATGAGTTYPGEAENANWQIDRDGFAWTGDGAFNVKVKTCKDCAFETRSFTLP